jgi:GntP family gluconate:H+ symporter
MEYMFGLSPSIYLLLDASVAIVGLIFLISVFKLHPFIALILAALFLGMTSGMPMHRIVKSFQHGFGDVLGFVGIVIGLGTMLGKMLADSGGADRIADTLVSVFGKQKVQWAMMLTALLVGIPLFFEIGMVLLMPLVFVVALRTGVPLLKIGLPLLAGLSVVHCLIPPHPGPMLGISLFGADVGQTILYGLIVGVPTAIIAGPLFGSFISRYVQPVPAQNLVDQIGHRGSVDNVPSFAVTMFTILLPVSLMLFKSAADIGLDERSPVRLWADFIGDPIPALIVAVLVALFTFGISRGRSAKQMIQMLESSLTPIAAIILVIGAGGGFKQMLIDSGVGDVIGRIAAHANVSPILLAWLVAAVIRIATGSATVATISAAGIVAPIVARIPGVNHELLVLAAGSGSVILSHVNDAGFWFVKQYLNMSIGETFKSWTTMETLISIVSLSFIMILSVCV